MQLYSTHSILLSNDSQPEALFTVLIKINSCAGMNTVAITDTMHSGMNNLNIQLSCMYKHVYHGTFSKCTHDGEICKGHR
jgi:hypothetical protein